MDKNGHIWYFHFVYLVSFVLDIDYCMYFNCFVVSQRPLSCVWWRFDSRPFVNPLVNSDNKFFSMLCGTFNRCMKGSRIASWLKALCRKLRPKHLSTEKSNLKACRLGTKKDGDGWKKLHWVTRVSWGVFWRKWRILRNVEAYCSSNRRTKNWQRR